MSLPTIIYDLQNRPVNGIITIVISILQLYAIIILFTRPTRLK